MEVSVYRSARRLDTYLLVAEADALERVPEALLEHFGEPSLSFTFTLSPESSLQRVDYDTLCQRLRDEGFYLQLPPPDLP